MLEDGAREETKGETEEDIQGDGRRVEGLNEQVNVRDTPNLMSWKRGRREREKCGRDVEACELRVAGAWAAGVEMPPVRVTNCNCPSG